MNLVFHISEDGSEIPLSAVQFQTYNSTSSMSAVHKGAQQKLSEILERKVPCIKCVPHGVSLAIEHGCQESSLVGKTFATLENIFVFFTKSTKRNKELKDKLEEIENVDASQSFKDKMISTCRVCGYCLAKP